MKRVILIQLFVCLAMVCYAQTYTISAKVANNQDVAVEFAEALLLRNDTVLQSVVTDEQGIFSIEAIQGNYLLLIKQLGDTLYSQKINLVQNIDLGTIKVQQQSKLLQDITVTAQNKLIERRADRLVFYTTNLPSADGGDVLDILKVTPSLMVNLDNISIVGKGSVNVLINDRFLQLSGEELMNFLKSLRASDVQKIEVITTPPAKYEAEGNSGLINIVLKKAAQDTWNGSVFGNYTQSKYATGLGGGSFNYRKKKLSFFVNASYFGGKSYTDDETTILYPDLKWKSDGNYTNYSHYLSAQAGFDVDITDKITIGAQYLGSFSNSPKSTNNHKTILTNISDNSDAGLISTEGSGKSKSNTQSANFHSIFKLDTLGSKINFDFDFITLDAQSNNIFGSTTTGSQTAEIPNNYFSLNNILDRKITNYAAKIDVEQPLKKVNLNYGAKLSFTRTNNDIQVFDMSSGASVNDATQTNQFLYKENTQAVYISASTKFGKDKWEAQLGLRGESTQFEGKSVTMDTVFKKSYFELFPTAYLNYNMNDKNIFYIEYGRRISRPHFSQLNPFRSYSNPYYYFAGNPELKPTITNNVMLGYIFNNIFQAVLFFDKSKDNSGGGISILDKDGYTQVGTRLNYFDNYDLGIGLAYGYKLS
ncbi:MAG: TonB-dependent receptor, partial [Prevotellaceae bacterium]|nr:TonB-dependent receptor [Prevotellaceae bacterium]